MPPTHTCTTHIMMGSSRGINSRGKKQTCGKREKGSKPVLLQAEEE